MGEGESRRETGVVQHSGRQNEEKKKLNGITASHCIQRPSAKSLSPLYLFACLLVASYGALLARQYWYMGGGISPPPLPARCSGRSTTLKQAPF